MTNHVCCWSLFQDTLAGEAAQHVSEYQMHSHAGMRVAADPTEPCCTVPGCLRVVLFTTVTKPVAVRDRARVCASLHWTAQPFSCLFG